MEPDLYPLPLGGFKLVSAEASNAQIAELVGLTFEIFTNTVLFVQRTRGRTVTDFLDQDDAGQKEIFSTLFNLQCYEEALALVKPDAKKLSAEYDTLSVSVRELGIKLVTDRSTLASLQKKQEEFEVAKGQEVAARQLAVTELERELAGTDEAAILQQIAALMAGIKEAGAQLKGFKSDEQGARELLTGRSTLLQVKCRSLAEPAVAWVGIPPVTVAPPDVTRKAELEDALQTLRAARAEQDAEKKSFNKRQEGITAQLATAKRSQLAAIQQQEQVTEQRAVLTQKIDQITVCPSCQQEFATPEAKQLALKDLAAQLAQWRDVDLAFHEAAVLEAQTALDSLNPFDQATYDELVAAITTYATELQTIEQTVRAFTTYEKQLAIYEEQERNAEKASLGYAAKQASLALEIKQLENELPAAELLVSQTGEKVTTAEQSIQEASEVVRSLEAQRFPIQDRKRRLTEEKTAFVDATNRVFPDTAWLQQVQDVIQDQEMAIETLSTQLTVAQTRLALLDALQEAFGKEGIIAELFREYIPDIQRLANEYLLALTNGELSIEFSADRELKKKVDGVKAVRSQFDIQVSKRNGGSDYDLISGSEQNKAALVVNWALADLAYQHSNVSCNLRTFDECFESLDNKSTERLVALLLNHARTSGQVNLVITHSAELEDAFPAKIILQKLNGVSSLLSIG